MKLTANWREIVEAFLTSGMSLRHYGRLHNISHQTLHKWKNSYYKNDNTKANEARSLSLIDRNSFSELHDLPNSPQNYMEIRTAAIDLTLKKRCNSTSLASLLEQLWRL